MAQPPEKKIYLSDLQQGPVPETICVKVMRKWLYDGAQYGSNIRYIGLVLADEKGNYIYANIPSNHMQTKGSQVDLDKVYYIKKFNVKPSRQMFVPFIKPHMIEFSGYTVSTVLRTPPEGFPEYVYNFTSFSDIDPIYPQSTIFVVGEIINQNVTSQQKIVPMREVIIRDLRDEELIVTLWADHATNFRLPGATTPETAQSMVIMFLGCAPKTMNHKTQLSVGYASRWFFNPNIPEALPFYDSLRKKPVLVYQTQLDESDSAINVKPILLEEKKLAEIVDLDPYEFNKKGYKCTVTITHIPENQKYWYIGCAKCKKAQKEDMPTFYCDKCKCYQSKPFYKLTFIAEDETTQGEFFAYDVAARNIVRRDIKAVLNQAAKEPGFPKFLKETVSRKFTLHITLREDTFDFVDVKFYLVKNMLTDHDLEANRVRRLAEFQATQQASSPRLQTQSTLQQGCDVGSSSTPVTVMATPTMATPPKINEARVTTVVTQPPGLPSTSGTDRTPVQRRLFTHEASNEQAQADINENVGTTNPDSAALEDESPQNQDKRYTQETISSRKNKSEQI